MAERRMFARSVLLSDQFFDLSKGARALYVTLCMSADDDGMCASVKSLVRQCGSTTRELGELVEAGYLLTFPSGIHTITHWRVHNAIRKDRRSPTIFTTELAMLACAPDGSYFKKQAAGDNQMTTTCQPSVNQMTTTCQPSDNQVTTKRQPSVNQVTPKVRIG